MIKQQDSSFVLIRKLYKCSILSILVFCSLGTASFDKQSQQDSLWFLQNPHSYPIWKTAKEQLAEARGEASFQQPIIRSTPPPTPVRNIAEYEPVEGVLISHPRKFGIPDSLIRELAKDLMVYCVSEDPQSAERQFENSNVNLNNVTFYQTDLNSVYTRDFGPWWIVDGNNDIGIVNFKYNRDRPDDDVVPRLIATELAVPYYMMNLVHCGGNYMTDGHGISASSDLVQRENRRFTVKEIEEHVQNYLGVTKYHLLEDPNTTTRIDHIDCWGKFLAPDKVLIRQVPAHNVDFDKLETVNDYFKQQKSSYGTPYKIYRITSIAKNEAYTNSLIANSKVLIPLSSTANDQPALEVYKKAMPGYQIIGFENEVQAWQNSDALHCRTKGVSDRGMLSIIHKPLHDTVHSNASEGYTISVNLIAYSKKDLYVDSCMLFYKHSGADSFTSAPLKHVSQNSYKAKIPCPPTSCEVAYYIHAADQSGRSENLPYVGMHDPFLFYASVGSAIKSQKSPLQVSVASLHCYPNPFSQRLHISCNGNGGQSVSKLLVYNNQGRQIKQWTLEKLQSLVIWDGTDQNQCRLASGVYFIMLYNGKTKVVQRIRFTP